VNEIKQLFDIVGHRKHTLYIILFSIVVAIVEFVGLALIVPYISIASTQRIPQNEYLSSILSNLNITTFYEFMIFISTVIVSFYIFRLIANLLFQYISLKYINKLRHIVMSKLFSHYAHIDYAHFVIRNSSDLKKTLLAESLNIQSVLKAMIDIVSESFVLALLLGLVFYTDWKLALVLLVVFTLVFYIFIYFFKNKIIQWSQERASIMKGVHRELDETLSNFKFMKLIGAEEVKVSSFESHSINMSKINVLVQMTNQAPKYFIETLGLIVIVAIIFYTLTLDASESFMGILAIYAVAFYRALPSLNKIMASFSNFQYFRNTIEQVYNDLNSKRESYTEISPVEFRSKIEVQNLTFKYNTADKMLFNNLNISIEKNQNVAITGPSGCGKSTLVDILMGLLNIENSTILVDGKKVNSENIISWRKKFGYIPQEIYLYDGTVADNIAFGREYDEDRIITVLKQANIYEYLQAKDGLETVVGEGGMQLSGGQKQRLGIARALYDNPEILVLDEATSALDNETEKKIMDEIYNISKDKTLIIIAHRLSTIEQCDTIIDLNNI